MGYSPKEVVDMAVEIEETGYHFYSECAKKFDSKNLKTLFEFLAEEELRHKDIFETLFKEVKIAEGVFTDEYYQYLNIISGQRIFKDSKAPSLALQGVESSQDALSMALLAEKDSILFYYELMDMQGSDPEMVSILKKIINEERKHIILLMDTRDKLPRS